ncbi:MAG: IS66 family transposase [bacterium]|nr:IS66 family transposase [bacterium]
MQVPEGYILIKQEEYNELKESIRVLQETIVLLTEKLAKLSKTSINSSKPPSSDIVKQGHKKDKSKKGKIGGQPGHPKHERKLYSIAEVHNLQEYNLTECPVCHHSVDIDLSKEAHILQQAEIIEVPVQIEEHKAHAYWCKNCQKYHYAEFPPAVIKAGLFKAKITAVVAYMKNVCHCSFSNIRKYFRDVLLIKVSRGYLSKVIQKVSKSLDGSYSELLNILPLTLQVNVDETGHKENGDKFWTWVFKTDLYVLFKIDKSRGSKVLIEVLGEEFNGVLGCDYFSAYRKYMKDFNITIQFCIAHLIREIKYLTSLPDKETKTYGQQLLSDVRELFKIIHKKSNLPEKDFIDQLSEAKNQILKTAIEKAPSFINEKGKVEKREVKNMVKRFVDHGKSYFEFITSPGVEPTNNTAEQAIRFVVIDRLVTQGTRSVKGRTANERLWTVIATCALQGKSAFEFIFTSVKAYFNNQLFPSLIPNSS